MTRTIIFVFLCIVTTIQSGDDYAYKKPFGGNLLDSFASSSLVSAYSRLVHRKIAYFVRFLIGCSQEAASSDFQELGKEAQNIVGIPVERQLPIKKILPDSLIARFAAGLAMPDAIYINEEKLRQRPYGAQRCALLHEAVHVKYNDNATLSLASLVPPGLVTFASYKLLANRELLPELLEKHRLSVAVLGGDLLLILTYGRYHSYMESRSDREGHYAAKCHLCITESAQVRRQLWDTNLLRDDGYLHAEALEQIAEDLKRQELVCPMHANHS